ncbi:hypothetical protein [Aquimarina sp. 2201CG5-10]|uniref:hypothetical protein n=1 Tax=Aquimarina callyspongiae TaxID=3098150 RepID=UPI002AB473FD|nr:hypothetical protein [Aquimarina sp. 2201CG5-10]MDY8136928.1 hypothetical protein [Aquimarina sp. 2201CG5-10]
MKRIILVVSTVLLSFIMTAQDDGSTSLAIDYGGELSRIGKAATSPEAAALTKHGNTPVSLYTGTPQISIPLYQHLGKEFNLPVQLSYDAQGIKVEQQATWVGLSWSLTIGGRVTRITNGMPDDYISSDYQTIFTPEVRTKMLQYGAEERYFDTEQEVMDYFTFLENVSDNRKDIEQDYFTVSAPGLNEMVVIDLTTMEARSLKNPRTKITYTRSGAIQSWTITNDTGTKYYFETKETTDVQGNDAASAGGILKEYVSSWLLTKIESPNLKDVYTFNYVATGYWNQPFSSSPVSHVTNVLQNNPNGSTYSNAPGSTFQPVTKLNQQFLSSVNHNGQTIISTVLKNRYDIAISVPSALEELRIHTPCIDEPCNTNNQYLKKIKFTHSYFGIPETANPVTSDINAIRLKLDEIAITNRIDTDSQKYVLTYEEPLAVPSKISFSQDYMGYYNGANNSVLYPRYTGNGDTYSGADRSPVFSNAKKGILTRITYPTGGHSLFEYEPHLSKTPSTNTEVTQDYTYGALSISGGTDQSNSDVCGSACHDVHGSQPPKIQHTLFKITDPNQIVYELAYAARGNTEAYLIKHDASALPEDHMFYSNTPIPYDQIVDQNTATIIGNPLWSNYGSADNRFITLEPGGYQLTLVNSTPGESSSVRIYREETHNTSQQGDEFIVPGLRIKNITDYTSEGQKASAKHYSYVPGTVIFNPTLVYTVSKTVSDGVDNVTTTTLHRLSGASSNQPHIVYGSVSVQEQNITNSLTENGYTKHLFNVGSDGIVTYNKRPYTNSYIPDYKVGKEKEQTVVDNSGTILSKTETTYEDPLYFSALGLSLGHNESNSVKYIRIYRDATLNKYTYEYLEPLWSGGQLGSGGAGGVVLPGNSGPAPAPPPICNEPGANCISRFELSTLVLKRNLMQGKIGNTIEVRSTERLGDTTIVRMNQMTYAPEVDYLLRSSTTTRSNQLAQEIRYYYPKDDNNQLLIGANRLTEVLQSESYLDGQKIATRKTIVKDWGDGILLPEFVQYAKGNATLEDRIVYHSYDNEGNPLEISQPDGSHTIYIWGYQGQYPVAKIDNATYTGMPVAVQDLITQIQNTSNSENTSVEETALRGLCDDLRNHSYFAEAFVTSYTYDPMIGVTSVTDPKGYKMSYEYDDFNRLEFVKDEDGNLVSENKYNYKN